MKRSKNRSKIETPHSDPNGTANESLASFIDSRSKKFLEKYGQRQKKIYEENAYTQPCSAESRKVSDAKHKRHTQMTAHKDVQTSTSLASSSVFESSSESISIPINSNSKSTTHYQPEPFPSRSTVEDNKKNSGGSSRVAIVVKQRVAITQTTDSICRTKPIYETRDKSAKFGTTSTTATQRVKKLQNDKQQQAHPPSIKYTLTFDKKSKPKVRQYASLPQQCNSEYATVTKSSKDIYNQMSYSASLNYFYEENKENYDNDLLFDDNADDDGAEDVDLQKCFNKKRPEIFTRFEQRKKCIEELKKLR
jgi:hypothetical protein